MDSIKDAPCKNNDIKLWLRHLQLIEHPSGYFILGILNSVKNTVPLLAFDEKYIIPIYFSYYLYAKKILWFALLVLEAM